MSLVCALSIWKDLKKQGYEVKEETVFTANRAWFDRFKTKGALHNIKMTGEAASSNMPTAEAFKPVLKEQIINFDEMGLYWKKMSSRTFITKEKTAPGFKASKDHLSLLLGGNAVGDVKLKLILTYHSENPSPYTEGLY